MKKCEHCNATYGDELKFCPNCGTALKIVDEFRNENSEVRGKESQARTESCAKSSAWVSEDLEEKVRKAMRIPATEQILSVIGRGYILNYLTSGTVKNTSAVLTDKRLYYKGRMLSASHKSMQSSIEEGSVRLKDISYTGIKQLSNVHLLICAILCAVLGLAGAVTIDDMFFDGAFVAFLVFLAGIAAMLFCLFKYKVGSRGAFVVYFPGGGLSFSMNAYSVEESLDFQESITRAIDKVVD